MYITCIESSQQPLGQLYAVVFDILLGRLAHIMSKFGGKVMILNKTGLVYLIHCQLFVQYVVMNAAHDPLYFRRQMGI